MKLPYSWETIDKGILGSPDCPYHIEVTPTEADEPEEAVLIRNGDIIFLGPVWLCKRHAVSSWEREREYMAAGHTVDGSYLLEVNHTWFGDDMTPASIRAAFSSEYPEYQFYSFTLPKIA